MIVPPLAIIQARVGSTRLPGKVLLPIGGETLIERVWRLACEAFGEENCVVAHPNTDENLALAAELYRIGARRFPWNGDERDVLGRFWHCAHSFRVESGDVIVRITPDDPFKRVPLMRRVAAGERLPVELSAEAFTLGMLDNAHYNERDPDKREHISYALFEHPAPPAPPGPWTVDTADDLKRARAQARFENGFWELVARGNGCWEWTGHRVGGYGTYSRFKAHRLSWEYANGPIHSRRLSVCHHCDNPGCVRPDHLFLGTTGQNKADSVQKGRHSHGEGHGRAKLTEEQARAIKANPGHLSQRKLAELYGVSRGAVNGIWQGRNWRWV